MAAHAQLQDDYSFDLERNLAEDLARAMQHRPLMSRLARIEASFPDAPGVLPPRPAPTPPPIPVTGDPRDALALNGTPAAPIDQLMEEFGAEEPMLPRTAEWLGKAQREHAQTRLRSVAAWFASLTIGGSMIALAALILKT